MRWLDADTLDGRVGLAPSTDGGSTGTRWQVQFNADGSISLECMGSVPGLRWLAVAPQGGVPILISAAGPNPLVVKWQVDR